MWHLLLLWRRVVKLFRAIALALSKGTKIIWSEKITEATDIANDYLDHKGHPKLDDNSDGGQNTSEKPTRTRWLRRRG
jgi:hypothetical protein